MPTKGESGLNLDNEKKIMGAIDAINSISRAGILRVLEKKYSFWEAAAFLSNIEEVKRRFDKQHEEKQYE